MTDTTTPIGGPMEKRSPRAVVVDDSAVVRELIAVNLMLEGFEVEAFADGEQAVAACRRLDPDVVTLDVVMPRLSGFEAVQQLRADPATAHIPIVIVTGRAQASDIARGEELGVEAYLTKPFEPAELVDVVTRLATSGRPAQA
jgi:CheY-like chemotaxis protein